MKTKTLTKKSLQNKARKQRLIKRLRANKKLRTRIIIEADIPEFKTLVLPELKHVPAKGEYFHLDERAYPIRARIIKCAEELNRVSCHVRSVEHHMTAKTHFIIVRIQCKRRFNFL